MRVTKCKRNAAQSRDNDRNDNLESTASRGENGTDRTHSKEMPEVMAAVVKVGEEVRKRLGSVVEWMASRTPKLG